MCFINQILDEWTIGWQLKDVDHPICVHIIQRSAHWEIKLVEQVTISLLEIGKKEKEYRKEKIKWKRLYHLDEK